MLPGEMGDAKEVPFGWW